MQKLIPAILVAAIVAGGYYYLNTSEALEPATATAPDETPSETIGETASQLVDQAGQEVAVLANQGQDLMNQWIEEGMLTVQNFDYDTLMASVQDSDLAQDIKTQATAILEEIKASPETLAAKIQELRELLNAN
ncbi:hypothetical protein [Ruegeria lacuscaerulensis]|uniref:hypothetical protein n=1 Tax=Ruegeria lacuscaerulensis TaxID=55218 RepID=UPI00147C63BD|nr:hypothetical protein [Ruegeria lacuscaerulensis]